MNTLAVILRKTFYKNCTTYFPRIQIICEKVRDKHQALSYATAHNLQKTDQTDDIIHIPKYLERYKNSSVDDMLDLVRSDTEAIASVKFLKVLRIFAMFKKTDISHLNNDKRFLKLCEVFKDNCGKLKPELLLSGMRSLFEIGMYSSASAVIAAEEKVLQNLIQFDLSNLITCLYVHVKFKQTNLQKLVLSRLLSNIQENGCRVIEKSELLMLFHALHLFDVRKSMEMYENIIEHIGSLKERELCKAICILAEKNNRNKPILNALSQCFRKQESTLCIKDIIDVLYSLKTLNFCDAKLILHLLDGQVPNISALKDPSLMSQLLTTCGLLKWKHNGILQACTDWILNNLDRCRSREFVAYIMTIAALNYLPPNPEETFRVILPYLSDQKVSSRDVWLDVVWSMAVLNILDQQTLQNTLSESFYQPLIDDRNPRATSNKLKLMNLRQVLKLSHPECVFRCNLNLEPVTVLHSAEKQSGQERLVKALSNFIPQEKYLAVDQNTHTGIHIDAEFIVNKDLKPFHLKEYGTLTNILKSKPLPEDARRVALLVLHFNDYTSGEYSLTGSRALAVRLLAEEGYVVIQVPYDRFVKNRTELDGAKYLLHKITESINSTLNINQQQKI